MIKLFIFTLAIFILAGCSSTNEYSSANVSNEEESLFIWNDPAPEETYSQNPNSSSGKAYIYREDYNPALTRAIYLLRDEGAGQYMEKWLDCLKCLRHDSDCFGMSPYHLRRLEIWKLLRSDIALLLNAAAGIDHMTLYELANDIVMSRRLDPKLYAEITQSISHAFTLDLNESSLEILARLVDRVESVYASVLVWWEDYLYRNPHLTYYGHDPSQDFPDNHVWDWTNRNLPTGAALTLGMIEVSFTHEGIELGVLTAMRSILYSTHGLDIQCFTALMAYVDDSIHAIAIPAMVNRIMELRDGGFEIYRTYLRILTNPNSVVDVRTGDIFNKINQLIQQHIDTR